ncbi:sodium:solute symporter [Thalassotalea sp. PS06]|uniref:sodium:solute symporter n=1 Tax=Thalassotalea sp. PS06 TaxID=2594005 RepID=UPI001165A58C|nr:sodium:solute symporter [Thalassotalea sp. PS06]QDP02148.1 sodium:solute symporter [Thalassotalea sp. PS06]
MTTQFATADWIVFAVYVLVMISTGWYFNRQKSANTDEYFLGGHKMPVFLVAISVLATSQSAATFLGGPDQGYRNDLSYLATNIGAFIAAFFVAFYLIPKFYQSNVTTVYELLSQRFGKKAQKQAGIMYLFGRVFASGARLYMAAIAVSMILFGNIDAQNVVISTLVLTAVGLLYSIVGGIRTVIYSDAIQCAVYVSAAILVLYFLLDAIPADFSQIVDALRNPLDREQSKLTILNFDLDFTSAGVFTFWSSITGFVLLNIAAFGLDQDMTQRVLTCKDARQGSFAMIYSVVMVIPVMFLFIAIGLLLYVLYQRPDLAMGESAETINQTFSGEKITIFMYYVLNEIPAGVKGLVTIGVIAAALSTLNSGLNSMASVLVQDIYRPYLAKQGISKADVHFVKAGQISMLLVALSLSGMAVLCYYWQQYSDTPLLAFALSVMVFSYSGLLGVYFTAVFTKRGNATTVPLALITGFVVSLMFQPYIIDNILPTQWQFNLGFTWQLCVGALLSFLVCFAGTNNHDPLKVKQMEVQP